MAIYLKIIGFMRRLRILKCPKCKSNKVIPIVYGLFGPEGAEIAERGEIELGGCKVRDERWSCSKCGNRW